MPLTYRIDSAADILIVIGEGVIVQSERLAAMNAWLADPAYRPGMPTLADFSAAETAPSLQEFRQLVGVVQLKSAAIGRKKLAIIAPQTSTFGAARQFQTLIEDGPLEVRVFTDRVASLAWLGRDSTPAA